MDNEERLDLAKHYREQSDEEIKELLQSGPDSFEKEAYDLLLMEARHRRFNEDVTSDITKTEKPLGEMTRGEILVLFMSAQNMETNLYNALCAEALRRNICLDEIDQFRKGILAIQKDEINEEEAETIPPLSDPLPLIITENLEDAQPFFKALIEAAIPYSIQIMVDESDYEKAEHVPSHLQPINN